MARGPRLAAPALACSLLLLLGVASSGVGAVAPEPEVLSVKVGVPGFDSHPFWFRGEPAVPEGGPGWTGVWQNVTVWDGGANFTGFMLPLLEWVCERAYLECELVPMYTMPEMIESVRNGTADFIGATLSVDPEYTEVVEFLQPYFYSAGVGLYMDEMKGQMIAAAGGWDAMKGEKICAKPGTPQMPGLEKEYGIVTEWVDTTPEACEAAKNGTRCVAFAFDSGRPQLCKDQGIKQAAGIQPIMTAPFALTVGKDNIVLQRRLAAALLETMKSGADSPILEWEKKYVNDQGALSNPELSQVVEAMSYFQVSMPDPAQQAMSG